MLRTLFSIFIGLFLITGHAAPNKPLQAEQAFALTSHLNPQKQLVLQWDIAPSYYLYRDKLKISEAPDSPVKIDKINYPEGQVQTDELNGTYQVYSGTLKIAVPLVNADKNVVKLNVVYQGCSHQGFCYPPIKKTLSLNLNNLTVQADAAAVTDNNASPNDQGGIIQLLNSHNPFWAILCFLGIGLLLAFTPCVLPMIPILSGIIMGCSKNLSTAKTFSLSLAYVLGMALTYAGAGVVVAMLGSNVQTALQRPAVLMVFSALFVLLALSLFGLYQIRMPAKLQQRMTALSNRQQGGTYVGVFLMGAISSLIVSPCVTPALVGVLAYIANTGKIWFGATALLALGFGMGIPLLLIGLSAGKLLPKAGMWMNTMEKIFGVLMLAVAIWILARVLPGPVILLLWSILIIATPVLLGVFGKTANEMHRLVKGLSVAAMIYGSILMVGAVSGNSDISHPLDNWKQVASETTTQKLPFNTLTTMNQLEQALTTAKQEQKPVMIDFYADWCHSCVSLDHHVFTSPDVFSALKNYVLLRADVTANNAFDDELRKRFNVIAPPTIIFFDKNGKELTSQRIIGEVNVKEFLERAKES